MMEIVILDGQNAKQAQIDVFQLQDIAMQTMTATAGNIAKAQTTVAEFQLECAELMQIVNHTKFAQITSVKQKSDTVMKMQTAQEEKFATSLPTDANKPISFYFSKFLIILIKCY